MLLSLSLSLARTLALAVALALALALSLSSLPTARSHKTRTNFAKPQRTISLSLSTFQKKLHQRSTTLKLFEIEDNINETRRSKKNKTKYNGQKKEDGKTMKERVGGM